jgi:L-2-hydroxyglutarate oxidase LhgO
VPELVSALEGDIQHNGGLISLIQTLSEAEKIEQGFKIICNDGSSYEIDTRYLVNASGLIFRYNLTKN